jgi:hypothetical protein
VDVETLRSGVEKALELQGMSKQVLILIVMGVSPLRSMVRELHRGDVLERFNQKGFPSQSIRYFA